MRYMKSPVFGISVYRTGIIYLSASVMEDESVLGSVSFPDYLTLPCTIHCQLELLLNTVTCLPYT
jgi:hypothetical protein